MLDVKGKLRNELCEAAAEANVATGLTQAPNSGQIERAAVVRQFTKQAPDAALAEATRLVGEIETTRAKMPPGNERTHVITVTLAKMRTIWQASSPLRHELAASPSPGKHL